MDEPSINELIEIVLDGLSKGVEKLGPIQALAKAARSIRDELAIRKIVAFLEGPKGLSIAQRSSALFEITSTMKDERIGELLITYIDRSQSPNISKMMGRAFYALGTDRITGEEFWSIVYGLSVLPPYAIQSLYRNENRIVDGKYTELFGAAGIAWLAVGGGLGGAGGFFSLTGRLPNILVALRDDEVVDKYS